MANGLTVDPPAWDRRKPNVSIQRLDALRLPLRISKYIHVVGIHASSHSWRIFRQYLQRWAERITVHLPPANALRANLMERIWRHLHEVITRNCQHDSIDEFVGQVCGWFRKKCILEVKAAAKGPVAA